MRINFSGDVHGLEKGIEILEEDLGFRRDASGIPVNVEKSESTLEVSFDGKQGLIRYKEKVHFFRALGLFLEAMQKSKEFKIMEEPQFDMVGAMFDVSRNAVLKVDSIKKLLRKMAVMGLNMAMLYTEDIYEVEGEPYFGYMRGRYTADELKECDDYADMLGIEMIPCIQTLAHLEQFLRWDAVRYLKDTREVLLSGSDRTYEFIERIIRSISASFRSKRIHIGMDEAHGLGLGRYLAQNGFRDRYEVMLEHLNRVLKIARKYNLKPMMWSDMFFRLGVANKSSEANYDEDSVIPEEVLRKIPKDVQMVFWEYYTASEKYLEDMTRRHLAFGSVPIFAGGLWTWIGMGTHYRRVFSTTEAALKVCKSMGIREVFTTLWMDDGGENNFFSALLGLQLYAEHGYARTLDQQKLKDRVKFCTGVDYQAFMDISYLNATPGAVDLHEGGNSNNPSKFLLWQDLLLGLFDRHVQGLDLSAHYSWLEGVMAGYREKYQNKYLIFEVLEKLCGVLKLKSEMGVRLKKAYEEKDKDALARFVKEILPELSEKVAQLRAVHKHLWFELYKPFGWEVMDLRYGGLTARIGTTIERVGDFLEGRIDRIEELEQERLFYDGCENREQIGIGSYNQYFRIATPNAFTFAVDL